MSNAPTEFTGQSDPKSEVALTRWEATPTDQEIRDSVVQRFEYTYELLQDVAQATAGDVS